MFIILLITFGVSRSQMSPRDLARDFLVDLVMKDSSQFFGIVLQKPAPDRILFQTRYGRLEIPLQDISYAIDYRFNYVLHDNLLEDASKNAIDVQKNNVLNFTGQQKAEFISLVHTDTHDDFRGNRYLFDDSAHVVLSTDWGDLYFKYPNIRYIDNYSGKGDRRNEFYTTAYLTALDPRASQTYITPTAIPYGEGNNFIADYFFGGLQMNFGPTNWLSTNLGGVFLPLKNNIIVATAGLKVTPYESELWHLAVGGQGLYSEVVSTVKLGMVYGAATYGRWDANLTLLAGATWKNALDSNGIRYNKQENLLAIAGSERVGENLKFNIELFFIQDFDIVPVLATIRYFQNDLTIDIGVVFSLYTSGASRTEKSLGEYVFNAPDFPIIPVISGSYHF
ncbi:MAG TPA: hypothetical protein VEW28_05065 [Candidatus Kapabacteria bacterium]|nr:hypothetical protein [Candidatus Kapabacteria bacterium]